MYGSNMLKILDFMIQVRSTRFLEFHGTAGIGRGGCSKCAGPSGTKACERMYEEQQAQNQAPGSKILEPSS